MLKRCLNKKRVDYPFYGGRGIKVCDRWRTFLHFLSDMGEKPAGKTLERIDNSLGYCPENCRWVTRQEQANNRRSNRTVVVGGKKMTVAEAARAHGLKFHTLQARLNKGWPIDRAINTAAVIGRNQYAR